MAADKGVGKRGQGQAQFGGPFQQLRHCFRGNACHVKAGRAQQQVIPAAPLLDQVDQSHATRGDQHFLGVRFDKKTFRDGLNRKQRRIRCIALDLQVLRPLERRIKPMRERFGRRIEFDILRPRQPE